MNKILKLVHCSLNEVISFTQQIMCYLTQLETYIGDVILWTHYSH